MINEIIAGFKTSLMKIINKHTESYIVIFCFYFALRPWVMQPDHSPAKISFKCLEQVGPQRMEIMIVIVIMITTILPYYRGWATAKRTGDEDKRDLRAKRVFATRKPEWIQNTQYEFGFGFEFKFKRKYKTQLQHMQFKVASIAVKPLQRRIEKATRKS